MFQGFFLREKDKTRRRQKITNGMIVSIDNNLSQVQALRNMLFRSLLDSIFFSFKISSTDMFKNLRDNRDIIFFCYA